MENIHDVLQHLVRGAHFRSEEDRRKASEIVTDAFAEPESADNPEANPEDDNPEETNSAIPSAPVLSPDGTQEWTGSEWVPVQPKE